MTGIFHNSSITPAIFRAEGSGEHWSKLVTHWRSLMPNTLLVDYRDGELRTRVIDELNQRQDSRAAKIRSLLSEMSRASLVRTLLPDVTLEPLSRNDACWFEQAMMAADELDGGLHGLIAPASTVDLFPTDDVKTTAVRFEDLDLDDRWHDRPSEATVPRERRAVVDQIRTLLYWARTIKVADYIIYKTYLDDETRSLDNRKRFLDTIRFLLQTWMSSDQPRAAFEVHTLYDAPSFRPRKGGGNTKLTRGMKSKSDVERELLSSYRTMFGSECGSPSKIDASVTIHVEDGRSRFTRERFLLTEMASVNMGKGFDLYSRSGSRDTVIRLLDRSTAHQVLNAIRHSERAKYTRQYPLVRRTYR